MFLPRIQLLQHMIDVINILAVRLLLHFGALEALRLFAI